MLDTKVLGSPHKRREASFMRMLHKEGSSIGGSEVEEKNLEDMMNVKKRKY